MRYLLLLICALVVGNSTMQAQEYLNMIDAGTYSVQEIIDNAENYFIDRDKGKGSGYVQFKRWEYMARRLMNENGYLRTITEDISELQRYDAYLNETASEREQLSDDWTELGPTYWNATTAWSPGVGRITGISVDLTDNNHIIVGAETGGVWKTTDGGVNWTPLGDYFSNLYVYSVRIDPSNSNTYYFGSRSGLIYKSTDAGATWNQLADINNSAINKILVHPTNSDIMFASGGGIYKSTDAGASWIQAVTDNAGYDIEFKPGDPSVVYVSGNGVHRSTDGGTTFSTIAGFSTGPKMMGVSADDDSRVYVVEAAGGSFNGFYASTDSGATFTELDHTGRNYFGYDTNGNDPGGQAPRDMDIAVNPADVDEVHIAGILTWRSTDGGANFNITSDWIPDAAAGAGIGYCHADVDILEYIDTNLFVGSDGGIFKADDTSVVDADYYEDLTDGIGIRQWYKIGVSQTPDVVITGGSQDNGSSFYTEADGWRDWIGADGMEGFIDKDDALKMYGMIQFGGMYRTINGGVSLVNMAEPSPGSGNWVSPFEQDPTDTNTIYCGYSRVWKSINSGVTWTAASQDFIANLDQLKIAPTNNQVMYASRGVFMYRTSDGGATDWTQVTSPGGSINSIAIHPTNPDKIAVAHTGAGKVRVSNDGGTTWIDYLFNLPNFTALAVIWDDNGADALYAGLDYGIYYIDNTFTEWQPYSNNIPNVIINEFDINNETNLLYAGTYGRGTWVSPLGNPNLGIADRFSEDNIQVYPNPAKSEITLSLPTTSEVDIRVFDLLGKLRIYEADVLVANRHTIGLTTLSSGVYFIRINSEKGTVTKKFIKE